MSEKVLDTRTPRAHTDHMTSVRSALTALLAGQGRTARPGQIAASKVIDQGALHTAAQCPTGVGKSALAVATCVAAGGGVIAVNSNGLVAQYAAEAPEWEAALGIEVAVLVGKAHYWCPKASPDLAGLTADQKSYVKDTGSFIGSGVDPRTYKSHSVASLSNVQDEEETDKVKSPCDDCPFKSGGCPLWAARNTAAGATIVVTNASMLGVSILGGPKWAEGLRKPVIVLDEADSCQEPLAAILGAQITLRDERAAAGLTEALNVVFEIAGMEGHKMVSKARKFLALRKLAASEGRKVQFSQGDDRVVLTIPADLEAAFATRRVVAMSATLSQRNVDHLGLSATVQSFQGLDVSASTVTVQNDAPKWAWGKANPEVHGKWAAHVATQIAAEFDKGGRTLGLFVSKDDLFAVIKALPAHVRSAVLEYHAGVDRVATMAKYTAAPQDHVILGCNAGAGRGLNLPGDLLRRVVVSRVPANAPKGANVKVWQEDSRAAVTQSIGRAHRHEGDWGHVTVIGGWNGRDDVQAALVDLGWTIQ